MEIGNIKFKAKRLDNGEWVEGDLKHSISYIGIDYPSIVFPDVPIVRRVDPDTVCIFTGLKDKNGTPIYKENIVIYKDNNAERRSVIIWDNESIAFYFGKGFFLCHFPTKNTIVIGNKFDK